MQGEQAEVQLAAVVAAALVALSSHRESSFWRGGKEARPLHPNQHT